MKNPRLKQILALFAALAAACPAAAAIAPVTVGDPHAPAGLAPAIEAAYKSGARNIAIRPGTYFLPNVGHTAITLDGWKNATLSGYGATLILTDLTWTHDAVDLKGCTGVTLSGMTLSQNQITSYQGRVIAVGKDEGGKSYCDWKPDAGYPVPPPAAKNFLSDAINVVDRRTRLFKVGDGDYYGVPYKALPGGTFRAQFNGHAEVGDWLVGRYGNAPFKVDVGNCHGCTLKDVTLVRNGFAPLREEGGGGNRYLHVVWALGPPPAGATEKPLVTNAADGMHMTSSYPGPDIENCIFQGLFLDDCIAIHGYLLTVEAAHGPVLTLKGGAGELAVGGPVRISDNKGFFGEASAVSLKDNGDGTTTLTLDKDLGVPIGAKLSNPHTNEAGYKIIGCRLGNTRSRGILAKADNGTIQGNTIEGCGQAAVSLGPEYYWGEADYVRDVTVEGNIMRGNGGFGYGGGAVLVHGDGAIGNRGIVIRNNKFASNYQGDIDVQWADGVTIAGNLLTGAPIRPAVLAIPAAVSVANARAVTLQANVVRRPGTYKPALVAVGDNVTGLLGSDPAGIRPAAEPGRTLPQTGMDAAPPAAGSLTDPNILYVGRWDKSSPAEYHSYWTCTYLRVGFTGTSVQVRLAERTALTVSIDGAAPHIMSAVAGETALSPAPLAPGRHTLLVGSAGQNEEVRLLGLTLDPDGSTFKIAAQPIVEFIGDSITILAGAGNYSWQSAEALNCDHTQIAFSGVALTSGYGCSSKVGQDMQYFRLKNYNHASDDPAVPWNFSYTPRVVVINLGQNDQCGSEPDAVMQASYADFIRKIQARFPKVQIAALRPFGGPYEKPIRAAVEGLAAAGDTRVHYIDTTGWLDPGDYSDGIHPNTVGLVKVTERLTPLLKPLLGKAK